MSAVDTLRAALFGVPPTSTFKPSREGVLQAFEELQNSLTLTNFGIITYETKALMDAVTPSGSAARIAFVIDDPTPANNNVYAYHDGAWSVYDEFYDGVSAVVQPLLDAAELARDQAVAAARIMSPFVSTVTDEYLLELVEDIAVDFGVSGRGYVLQWRSDTAGATRRLQFALYDPVRGAVVARYEEQHDYDWSADVLESVYLSGSALGSVRGDLEYVGAGVTLFLKPGAVDFTKGVQLYTDPTNGGINPDRVWSPEETQRRILSGQGVRNKIKTFGPDGDFATLKAGVDFLLRTDIIPSGGTKDDIQRGWWPFSDLCTPAHQWTLQAMPGHSETKLPVFPAGVPYARGVLCWMGLTIRLLNDTVLKGEASGGNQTYYFDYNLGGRIISDPGALIWTDGVTTAAVHQDAQNGVSVPSVANASDPTAGQLHFRITGLIENGRYKSVIFPWAAGTSDGQDIRFKGPILEVTGGSGENFFSHTSPSNQFPGGYDFDSITLIGGSKSLAFGTSNTVVARHGIRLSNSDVSVVGASGSGFMRIGKQPGVTYDADMEP